jgi:hypothetical protein
MLASGQAKKGSYEDPILMATFAFGHLKFVVGAHADSFKDYPFAGMALSLAAVSHRSKFSYHMVFIQELAFLA